MVRQASNIARSKRKTYLQIDVDEESVSLRPIRGRRQVSTDA